MQALNQNLHNTIQKQMIIAHIEAEWAAPPYFRSNQTRAFIYFNYLAVTPTLLKPLLDPSVEEMLAFIVLISVLDFFHLFLYFLKPGAISRWLYFKQLCTSKPLCNNSKFKWCFSALLCTSVGRTPKRATVGSHGITICKIWFILKFI